MDSRKLEYNTKKVQHEKSARRVKYNMKERQHGKVQHEQNLVTE